MICLAFFVVFIAIYLFCRLSLGITRSNVCLIGKTAIITGANSGIGYQTALNLASRGCRVIMADVADMTESKRNIIKYTNNPNIVTKKLDLASLESVRDFAKDIVKTEDRLDILINNAGIAGSVKETTEDGLNPVMQINYFGHFLLTHLLIDLLKRSAPSRIVFTSSFASLFNNLSVSNLKPGPVVDGSWKLYHRWSFYCNSKVATILASDIFAEKLEGSGVTSNCVHPGLVNTPIVDNAITVMDNTSTSIFLRFSRCFFSKDPWEGSQVLVHVAVSKKLEKVTGKYFADCGTTVKPWDAYKRKWCQEIWEVTEKLVRLEESEKL